MGPILSKLYTFNMFLLEIHKIIFYKKQFQTPVSKQNTCELNVI